MIVVRKQKNIGKCKINFDGRKIIISSTKGNSDTIGFEITFELDRRIINTGGQISMNWRWAPINIDASLENGVSIFTNRAGSPWKLNIPKSSPGADSRKVKITAEWDSKIIKLLKDGKYEIDYSFKLFEIQRNPVVINSGRGIRNDKKISHIGCIEKINEINLIPLEIMHEYTDNYVREFKDNSIHIDKNGPYFYKKILEFDLMADIGSIFFYSNDSSKQLESYDLDNTNTQYQMWHLSSLLQEIDVINSSKGSEKRDKLRIFKRNLESLTKKIGKNNSLHSNNYYRNQKLIKKETKSSQVQSLLSIIFIKSGILLGNKDYTEKGCLIAKELLDNLENNIPNFNNYKYNREYSHDNEFVSSQTQLFIIMSSIYYNMASTDKKINIKKLTSNFINIFRFFDLNSSMALDLDHFLTGERPKIARIQNIATQVMMIEWILGNNMDNKLVNVKNIMLGYL